MFTERKVTWIENNWTDLCFLPFKVNVAQLRVNISYIERIEWRNCARSVSRSTQHLHIFAWNHDLCRKMLDAVYFSVGFECFIFVGDFRHFTMHTSSSGPEKWENHLNGLTIKSNRLNGFRKKGGWYDLRTHRKHFAINVFCFKIFSDWFKSAEAPKYTIHMMCLMPSPMFENKIFAVHAW